MPLQRSDLTDMTYSLPFSSMVMAFSGHSSSHFRQPMQPLKRPVILSPISLNTSESSLPKTRDVPIH